MSPPQAYQADTGDLARFVERSRRHHEALTTLQHRIVVARRRTAEVLGAGPAVEQATLDPLLVATLDTTELADSVRRDLLTVSARSLPPALGRAVRDGRLPPPDDALRDRLLDAVVAGTPIEEAGIDSAYAPPALVRHRRLTARIAELEGERRLVDGHPLIWWGGDSERLATIDERLERLRDQLDRLSDEGLEPDGSIARLDAIALVADATGGPAWEGRRYAELLAPDLRGPVGEAWQYRPGLAAELDHVADGVATDHERSVAFYREVGAAGAARLPTLTIAVAGAAGDEELATVRAFGQGLAAATHARDADGAPSIGFAGADLLDQPIPDGLPGAIGLSPAMLLAFGRFEPTFLADATVTALRLGQVADPRGSVGHWRWDADGEAGGTRLTILRGEDPRNVLLAQAAVNPEAARLVVRRLTGDAGSTSGPGSLDPLLRPAVPFDAVARANPGAADSAATPHLDDPYPITTFLGVVAGDAESSNAVIGAVAEAVGRDGPIVGDVGTAAGLDLLLAWQVASVVDPEAMADVGQPSGDVRLVPVVAPMIGPAAWRAVHGEVLRWGRGQAVAVAADELARAAIVASLDDGGSVDLDRVRPFAHLAGRAEAEAWAALFARAATLDDEARRRNRDAGRAMALLSTGVGFAPWGWTVATPASLAWAWFVDGIPTDAELREHRQAWAEVYERGDPVRWQRSVAEAWLERQLGSAPMARIELVVPELGRRTVDVGHGAEPGTYRWRHPQTGNWSPLPLPGDDGGVDLLPHDRLVPMRRAMAAGTELAVAFQDGVDRGPRTDPDEDTDPDGGTAAAWTDQWFGRR
ncbi:MAG: hypothetical protein AAGA93_01950 [Actinomycetota bacterium]